MIAYRNGYISLACQRAFELNKCFIILCDRMESKEHKKTLKIFCGYILERNIQYSQYNSIKHKSNNAR